MESETLASFLGRTDPEARTAADDAAPCPHCGHTWVRFQQSSRLGCARCYTAFRARLVPLLAGFHRHALPPGQDTRLWLGAATTSSSSSTRLRIAMEKAIVGEDFETAARLRDTMRGLEDSATETGDQP